MSARLGFAHLVILIVIATVGLAVIIGGTLLYRQNTTLRQQVSQKTKENNTLSDQLRKTEQDLANFKNQDQVKINEELKLKVSTVEGTLKLTIKSYELVSDLKKQGSKNTKLDELLTKTLAYLSELNYASGSATLANLNSEIKTEQAKIAATSGGINLANVPLNNAAPGSGYSRQVVKTDRGEFLVDIITGDLGSTRVIIDTASDDTCRDNCPVLSVGEYGARSGAYAAINGTYFCPADYPSCAGKTNSFDLLVMNKNKKYLNSDNNVYSTNPAAIFSGGSARFVGKAQEWGRDTGVDGVISNFPMLTSGGNNLFSGNDDPKQSSKGTRGFLGATGSKAYIGMCHNCSVAESATIMKALGIENSINLDSGGSAALWSSGRYIVGPGRNVPNAVLFVRK